MPSFYLFIVSFIILLASCKNTNEKKETKLDKTQNTISKPEIKKLEKPKLPQKISNDNAVAFLTEYGENNPEQFVRLTTKFGDIEIELYNDTPLHRANFIHIVKRKFLDETCFYRVAKEFVIQGGNSDKMSMAKIKNRIGIFTIPSEFKKTHKHHYGTVAMARIWKGNPEKRSSPFEFYIVADPKGSYHLDNEHTIIGRVTKGMNVVKKINVLEVDKSEWPIDDVYMTATIIE